MHAPRMRPTDEWQYLASTMIDVYLNGRLYRTGMVDLVMPDASALWLAPDWPQSREYIDKASGYKVWTSLYPPPQPNSA